MDDKKNENRNEQKLTPLNITIPNNHINVPINNNFNPTAPLNNYSMPHWRFGFNESNYIPQNINNFQSMAQIPNFNLGNNLDAQSLNNFKKQLSFHLLTQLNQAYLQNSARQLQNQQIIPEQNLPVNPFLQQPSFRLPLMHQQNLSQIPVLQQQIMAHCSMLQSIPQIPFVRFLGLNPVPLLSNPMQNLQQQHLQNQNMNLNNNDNNKEDFNQAIHQPERNKKIKKNCEKKEFSILDKDQISLNNNLKNTPSIVSNLKSQNCFSKNQSILLPQSSNEPDENSLLKKVSPTSNSPIQARLKSSSKLQKQSLVEKNNFKVLNNYLPNNPKSNIKKDNSSKISPKLSFIKNENSDKNLKNTQRQYSNTVLTSLDQNLKSPKKNKLTFLETKPTNESNEKINKRKEFNEQDRRLWQESKDSFKELQKVIYEIHDTNNEVIKNQIIKNSVKIVDSLEKQIYAKAREMLKKWIEKIYIK